MKTIGAFSKIKVSSILLLKFGHNICNHSFSPVCIISWFCSFIFSDDKPIGCIFYNQELFEELGRRKEIGFDGTFYVVPDPFYQLWTGKISVNELF